MTNQLERWALSTTSQLMLFQTVDGAFVNRYGANGEQFRGSPDAVVIDCESTEREIVNVPVSCGPRCTLAEHETATRQVASWGSSEQICKEIPAGVLLDGTPLFFPIDGHPDAFSETNGPAGVPEQYAWSGWPAEQEVTGSGRAHNFLFTSEIRHAFVYDEATSPSFEITGDDDLWVFVNNQLVIDLGGIHVPISGQFTLNTATASSLGLSHGSAYEVAVFQADRRPEGSTLRVTFDGFAGRRASCEPICGDGVVSAGEECDDGENDGGYGECEPGCVAGDFCGDGVVQANAEDCDDGNRINGDGCEASCRVE